MIAPLPGLSSSTEFEFAGGNVFSKIFDRRDVLGDEILARLRRKRAGRVVECLPRACLAGDEAGDQKASCDAVGDALRPV